ncbi:mucin-6-like [Anomaloglossus baeobatrachus]|uniref:mucin-6-like n=1 Tax=Anomaloglossus baeobatrachus TaxID=238106 RepID=UPI003F4FC5F3
MKGTQSNNLHRKKEAILHSAATSVRAGTPLRGTAHLLAAAHIYSTGRHILYLLLLCIPGDRPHLRDLIGTVMVRAFAALLGVLLMVITAQSADDEESCNAVDKGYSACNAHCQPSCDNLKPEICSFVCMPGCICRDGLVNNGRDECIKPEQCSQCKGNTTYSEQGNECTDSCEAVNDPEVVCTRDVKTGCFCKKGYASPDGGQTCVLHQDCPKPRQ